MIMCLTTTWPKILRLWQWVLGGGYELALARHDTLRTSIGCRLANHVALLLIQKISFKESELSPERVKQNKTKYSGRFKVHTGLMKTLGSKMEERKETWSDISVLLLEVVSSVFSLAL